MWSEGPDLSNYVALMQEAAGLESNAAGEKSRPSHLLRPRLFIDGDHWCALYGDDLQAGVAGFGDSPEKAFRDFDAAWTRPLKAREASNG